MTTSPSDAPPFGKILVANRGEIACRIMRTARRMGIATVAVYSDADRAAPHAEMADEAVAIGPAPSAQSYLAAERIVAAARDTGAEAVHPGFGFLSENADFARALQDAGIVFVGPGPEAIAAMGDKIESKRLAAAAGVDTIPGHPDPVSDVGEALAIAARIGYPVMMKASAGGGGKGMRAAEDPAAAAQGFEAARNEARAAFGDDRMLIEKFVAEPRHIEIQVLADGQGAAIHLGERECSIQRRHQKVIEEAPSPFVDPDMRAAMGAQAVALARAVGYRSAGTVEFVAGSDKSFYFLEMNTRLQVEHPVTEAIFGIDLVEWMLRIAAGERLGLRQEDIRPRGWAIEARLYAEDPARGFLPSTGRLRRYREPDGEGIRIDSGVAEGSDISMHYDPMIAKAVARGADRAEAASRLAATLDGFEIEGVRSNVSFLRAVMDNPRFRAGRLTTAFIAEEYGDAYDAGAAAGALAPVLAPVAAAVHRRDAEREARLGAPRELPETFVVRLGEGGEGGGGETGIRIALRPVEDGYEAVFDGRRARVRMGGWRPGDRVFRGAVAGRETTVGVARGAHEGWRLTHGGAAVRAVVRSARAAELAARMPRKPEPDLSRFLLSPMPGLVVSVAVGPGQKVQPGDPLCVIDAMKMENVLRADRPATVEDIKAAPGASVQVDQVLMTFADAAAADAAAPGAAP